MNNDFGKIVSNETVEIKMLKYLEQENREMRLKDLKKKFGDSGRIVTNLVRKGKVIKISKGIYKINPKWIGNVERNN